MKKVIVKFSTNPFRPTGGHQCGHIKGKFDHFIVMTEAPTYLAPGTKGKYGRKIRRHCVSFNIGCIFAVAKICRFLLQVSDILYAAKYRDALKGEPQVL